MSEPSRIRPPYSVSELTEEIRLHLEDQYEWVQVNGEISNFKKGPTGHVYFRLKDANAVLECVAWKSTAVRWSGLNLRDGEEVIAGGQVTVYPPRGQYQLVVSTIRLAGLGVLQLRFEELKQRLAQDGLFDSNRKRPLPKFPSRIAIITSPTGAAVRDFIKIIRRSACPVAMTVCPVLVQGVTASSEIADMLQRVNRSGDFDLIVLCRGGGSLEDLWAFNEEKVARAIYESQIPVLTGIGHEIDFTIADFVADIRASTPTAAAQVIGEIFDQYRAQVHLYGSRLIQMVPERLEREREQLEVTHKALKRYHPMSILLQWRQRLDEIGNVLGRHVQNTFREDRTQWNRLKKELQRVMVYAMERHTRNLNRLQHLVQSFNPRRILERGFAVCRTPEGKLISKIAQVQLKDQISVQVSDGGFQAEVLEVKKS